MLTTTTSADVEHDDLLELEPAAVVGAHHEDGRSTSPSPNGMASCPMPTVSTKIDVEAAAVDAGARGMRLASRGESPPAWPRVREAAHEDAVVLRVDHRGAVAEQRAVADDARVVREDRDAHDRVGT